MLGSLLTLRSLDCYRGECAHTAHQPHVDAWIAAASERLHVAVTEHPAAVAEAHERDGRATAGS